MNKKVFILLFSLIPIFVIAQENTIKWNYPIRPGTEKWEQLNSFSERLDAFNIPDSVLKQISTKELVKTCINYPYWILVISRNNNQEGYNFLKSVFNGFRELEQRTDSGIKLLKMLDRINPGGILNYSTLIEQGNFSFRLTYIEILISQPEVLKSFNNDDFIKLIKKALSIYDGKINLPDKYSANNLFTTCLILGRSLEQKSKNYTSLKIKLPDLIKFNRDGRISNIKLLNQIVTETERYLLKLDQHED